MKIYLLKKVKIRKKLFVALILSVLFGTAGIALAQEESEVTDPLAAENFSATLTFTTDYVSQGISSTDREPAIQGSFDYAHPGGFYLGLWASNWEDTGGAGANNIELDYYIGYYGEINDLWYDVSGYYYQYPDADDDGFEYNYVEIFLKTGYGFTALLSPALELGYAFSPDYSGEDGTSHYFYGKVDLTLIENLIMGLEYGHLDVEGDKSFGGGAGLDGGNGFDYGHYRVGVASELKGFNLDLSYHDTSESDWLSANIGQADGSFVFTVSRTF